MEITSFITEYTGSVPNRQGDTPIAFAQNVYDYQIWIDTHFTPDVNSMSSQMNTVAQQVSSDKDITVEASNAALSSSNHKGKYSDLSGGLSIPASVSLYGDAWLLDKNLSDVTQSVPSLDNSDWMLITKGTTTISTVEKLKSLSNPISKVWLSGYHTKGDGAFGSHIFEWDETSTEADNGGTIIKLTNVSTGRYKLRYRGAANVKWFGADDSGATSSKNSFYKAWEVSNTIDVDDGIYDIETLYVPSGNLGINGESLPLLDLTTNTLSGGVILKGTIASSEKSGLNFKNFGLDSSAADKTEGFSIAEADNFVADNIIVLASDENNHNFLVERGNNVKISNLVCIGGHQGLAVKTTNFNIDNLTSYDQISYGCTVRYSPDRPCYNGFLNNIRCLSNLSAKGGGFIIMNNEQGAAVNNITTNGLIVDNCNVGVQIDNASNTVKATNITFNNIKLSNIQTQAFQTFGDVDDIQIDNINFKNCSGTHYTNQATGTSRITISNHKQDSSTGIGIISGYGHKLYNFEKEGGGGFFLQNTSALLEVYNMDGTVSAVSNITDSSGTGTLGELTTANPKYFKNKITVKKEIQLGATQQITSGQDIKVLSIPYFKSQYYNDNQETISTVYSGVAKCSATVQVGYWVGLATFSADTINSNDFSDTVPVVSKQTGSGSFDIYIYFEDNSLKLKMQNNAIGSTQVLSASLLFNGVFCL